MMNQILFAGVIGLFLTLIGTPLLIKLLARKGYGQYIRDDGPKEHHSKRGTPTMGGIAFILATIIAYFLSKVITGKPPTFSGLLVLGLMAAWAWSASWTTTSRSSSGVRSVCGPRRRWPVS